MDRTRPAPTGSGMDAPPAYAARINRMYKRDLRPVVLVVTAFAAIWSIAIGVSFMRNLAYSYTTTSLKTMYVVLGVMYLVSGAIEVYGFGAVWTRRLKLVRIYFLSTALAALVVTAAEVLRVVFHFVDKGAIIQSCVNQQLALNSDPNYQPITQTQAESLCTSSWNNSTWIDILLLIITAIVAFIFASLAAAYYHQLLNPATLRTQTAAPSSAYTVPLGPYPPYPQSADPYGVPAYSAPPPSSAMPPQYASQGWQGDLAEDKKDPFADSSAAESGYGSRTHDGRSEDTVTLEPRRDDEHRV